MEGSASQLALWERHISRFDRAYLAALREARHRYDAISEAFPEDMLWPTRSVAFYCRDGIILARYRADSGEDSFEFVVSCDETIYEVARRLGTRDLRRKAPNDPRAVAWFFSHSNYHIAMRDPDTGELIEIFRPDWYTFIASRGFVPRFWNPAIAISRARAEVQTFAAAHLLNLDLGALLASPAGPTATTFKAYQDVVDEFRTLIGASQREAELQDFLCNHYSLLALDAARALPQFQLGTEYRTDFVLEMGNEEYILVEIEAATRRLFNQNGDFSADFNHAIQQVEDWQSWIERFLQYIQAQLPGIVDPEGWVIIGRRPTDKDLRFKMARRSRRIGRIKLFTYDDLLDKAERQLATLRRYAD